MNVTFHALVGFGICHLAARAISTTDSSLSKGNIRPLLLVFVAGILSHGVLDGLKHGYPISVYWDPPLALALGVFWCITVKQRYRLMFVMGFVAVMLPDLIDQGVAIVNKLFGLELPWLSKHVFPWHWVDGSGSLYPMHGSPGYPGHGALDAGDNQLVSITEPVNYSV